MKEKLKNNFVIATVCFFLCFGVALQYKSITRNEKSEIAKIPKSTDAEVDLINAKQQILDLKKENMQLSSDLDIYRQEAASKDSGSAALKSELDNYLKLSGFTTVEGPGVIITVEDSKLSASNGASDTSLIVHDTDIRSIVNELYGAGAEAVSINGERFIANTPIRCVGNTIMINNKRCSSPYKIAAIGDPEGLKSSLSIPGGILDELKESTIEVNVTKNDKIKINKYTGSISFSYASDTEK